MLLLRRRRAWSLARVLRERWRVLGPLWLVVVWSVLRALTAYADHEVNKNRHGVVTVHVAPDLSLVVAVALVSAPLCLLALRMACNSRLWGWLRSVWDSPRVRRVRVFLVSERVRQLLRGAVSVLSFVLALRVVYEVLGVDLFFEGLAGSSAEEAFEKDPGIALGFVIPFYNPTLLWAVPAAALGWLSMRKGFPHRDLAKRGLVATLVLTVVSFMTIGNVLPLFSLAFGQMIHMLITM